MTGPEAQIALLVQTGKFWIDRCKLSLLKRLKLQLSLGFLSADSTLGLRLSFYQRKGRFWRIGVQSTAQKDRDREGDIRDSISDSD